jgi:hypothetical protein
MRKEATVAYFKVLPLQSPGKTVNYRKLVRIVDILAKIIAGYYKKIVTFSVI